MVLRSFYSAHTFATISFNVTNGHTQYLESDEEAFAELLAQKTDKELLKEKKHDEEELQKAIVRNETVSNLYEKLYEDNATGKVSDEWFMQLSHKYEVERLELKAKIKTLRQKHSECGQCERDRETFTSAIRRFMRMDRLTAPLLRELIDHIDVFETEGTGKSRHRESLSTTALSGMWKSPRYLKRSASKQTPEKALPWSISPSRYRHSKRAGIPPAHT